MTPQHTSWRTFALHLAELVPVLDGEPGQLRMLEAFDAVLSRMAGHGGSRSLLARALRLAQVGSKVLGSVRVDPEHIMDHLKEQLQGLPPEDRIAAEVLVVSYLLMLLHTFIGERLTLHLVQEAWPELDLQQIELHKEPRT